MKQAKVSVEESNYIEDPRYVPDGTEGVNAAPPPTYAAILDIRRDQQRILRILESKNHERYVPLTVEGLTEVLINAVKHSGGTVLVLREPLEPGEAFYEAHYSMPSDMPRPKWHSLSSAEKATWARREAEYEERRER